MLLSRQSQPHRPAGPRHRGFPETAVEPDEHQVLTTWLRVEAAVVDHAETPSHQTCFSASHRDSPNLMAEYDAALR